MISTIYDSMCVECLLPCRHVQELCPIILDFDTIACPYPEEAAVHP